MKSITLQKFHNTVLKERQAAKYLFQICGMTIIYYADDFIVFTRHCSAFNKLKHDLGKRLRSNDLRRPLHFSRIRLNCRKNGNIRMRMSGLFKDFLENTRKKTAKPMTSPVHYSLTMRNSPAWSSLTGKITGRFGVNLTVELVIRSGLGTTGALPNHDEILCQSTDEYSNHCKKVLGCLKVVVER